MKSAWREERRGIPSLRPTGLPAEEGGLGAVRLRVGGEIVAVIGFPAPHLAGARAITLAERAVIEGIACGLSNAEIARQRHRSVHTVANQVAAALRKLRVGSRAELLAGLIAGVGRPPR